MCEKITLGKSFKNNTNVGKDQSCAPNLPRKRRTKRRPKREKKIKGHKKVIYLYSGKKGKKKKNVKKHTQEHGYFILN